MTKMKLPEDLERIAENMMRGEILYAGDTPTAFLVYASKSTGKIYYADSPPDWPGAKIEELERHLIEYKGNLNREEIIHISDSVPYQAIRELLR
jgi:hypothetical protein